MVSKGKCGPGGWETRAGVRGFSELPFLRTRKSGRAAPSGRGFAGRRPVHRSAFLPGEPLGPDSGLRRSESRSGSRCPCKREMWTERFAIFAARFSAVGKRIPSSRDEKCGSNCANFSSLIGRTNDAQAEIAGLAADTPSENGALREENGRLFLRVGEPGKALAEFEAALQINPRQSQWLADAGQVAFEDGDYLKAETYFSRADRENPSDEIHASLMLVRDVLGNDPYLGRAER